MATITNNRSSLQTDPLRNFRFLVKFTPLDSSATGLPGSAGAQLGFTSVSGLSVTTDAIPYREGGYNTTFHQLPGQTTFSPITFQRGVVLGTSVNWNWMRRLFATVQGGPTTVAVGKNNFRCDIEIQVLSHPIAGGGAEDGVTGVSTDHVAMRFYIYNAWITSLAYSDLNAGDNAILVEQMTVVHEGFDASWATALPTGTTAADYTAANAPLFTASGATGNQA
jgi:phage tail-like protein